MDSKHMARLSTLLLKQEYSSLEDVALLQRNLISLISFKLMMSDGEGLSCLLEGLHAMMSQTQDYHFKPILAMLEAKYSLFHLKDRARAEKSYQDAILGARFLEDAILLEKLTQESQADLAHFDSES